MSLRINSEAPNFTAETTQGHRRNPGSCSELSDDRDPQLKVAKLYDMLPAEAGDTLKVGLLPTMPPCARCSSSAQTKRSRRC